MASSVARTGQECGLSQVGSFSGSDSSDFCPDSLLILATYLKKHGNLGYRGNKKTKQKWIKRNLISVPGKNPRVLMVLKHSKEPWLFTKAFGEVISKTAPLLSEEDHSGSLFEGSE